jgi:hypothetical protein
MFSKEELNQSHEALESCACVLMLVPARADEPILEVVQRHIA